MKNGLSDTVYIYLWWVEIALLHWLFSKQDNIFFLIFFSLVR